MDDFPTAPDLERIPMNNQEPINQSTSRINQSINRTIVPQQVPVPPDPSPAVVRTASPAKKGGRRSGPLKVNLLIYYYYFCFKCSERQNKGLFRCFALVLESSQSNYNKIDHYFLFNEVRNRIKGNSDVLPWFWNPHSPIITKYRFCQYTFKALHRLILFVEISVADPFRD